MINATEPPYINTLSLHDALPIFDRLHPRESNDPETLGLAGAVHKRLFELGQGDAHLESAVGYYVRGYYLRNDQDRKSTRLNSSHSQISYAVFCLKKKILA